MSTVLLPALASVALHRHRRTGRHRAPPTTDLALTAQTRLLHQADRYRQLEQEAADARTRLQKAREAEATARTAVAAQQQVVGAGAADLYRAHRRAPVPDARARRARPLAPPTTSCTGRP